MSKAEQLPPFSDDAIIHTDGPERIYSHNIPMPVATEPLEETEDVPAAPNHFMSWDEVQDWTGWTPEQFAQADTTTMSPVDVDSYFDDTQHIADYLASERDNMRLDKE